MDYLLDTNACIARINGEPATVRIRTQKAAARGAHILVSSVALFELWHGVAKSTKQEFNRKRLETFLAGPILVLPSEATVGPSLTSLRGSGRGSPTSDYSKSYSKLAAAPLKITSIYGFRGLRYSRTTQGSSSFAFNDLTPYNPPQNH